MAKTAGSKPFSAFELDYMRFGIRRGLKPAQIARDLRRGRQGVWAAIKKMESDGTINQLCLPGFGPKLSKVEAADDE